MKNLISISVLTIALLFSACHEITVKTKINKDGSFTRTIIVQSDDSSGLYKADLPYPIDASWKQAYVFDSTTKNKPYMLTYTKLFDGMGELTKSIEKDTSMWKNMARKLSIEKTNGFFFSNFEFKETIKAANPFTMLDYRKYLSNEDVELLGGEVKLSNISDSTNYKNAEEKVEQFFVESITHEIVYTLEEGIKKINSISLKPEDVEKYRDSIVKKVDELEDEPNEKFIDYLALWSGNEDYLKLKELEPPIFKESNKRMKLFYTLLMMEQYNQEVELPGMLTKTNSIKVVGNKVSWKVEPIAFMFKDYTMQVESRVVNYWAFVLSGIILVLLIAILAYKAFSREG